MAGRCREGAAPRMRCACARAECGSGGSGGGGMRAGASCIPGLFLGCKSAQPEARCVAGREALGVLLPTASVAAVRGRG